VAPLAPTVRPGGVSLVNRLTEQIFPSRSPTF
jgi:hypothetical protein